jgi:hypothetical protein
MTNKLQFLLFSFIQNTELNEPIAHVNQTLPYRGGHDFEFAEHSRVINRGLVRHAWLRLSGHIVQRVELLVQDLAYVFHRDPVFLCEYGVSVADGFVALERADMG